MKRIISIISILSMLLSLVGCAKNPNTQDSLRTTGIYFDTVISIEIWGTTNEEILNQCKIMCTNYENLFSRTIETSDISRLNAANGTPVVVDPETASLIETGLYYSRLSEGAFDITINALSTVWDIKNNPGIIPAQTEIDNAKSHVNYKNVVVDGNTITLTDPQASIDLGAIAKGYIADRLKAYLLKQGIKHGLINLGGNLVAIGSKPDGTDYHIGIQKPFDEQNAAITSVDVQNQSVVSSGIYERYFEKDGKRYHHLLNPFTGFPYENDLLQVSIISDNSVDGDALSTACFAMGLEEGTKLIESLDGIKAVFVTNDYAVHIVD